MKRDIRFVTWHGGDVDDPDECDCYLGTIWDISDDIAQAERLWAKHPAYLGLPT